MDSIVTISQVSSWSVPRYIPARVRKNHFLQASRFLVLLSGVAVYYTETSCGKSLALESFAIKMQLGIHIRPSLRKHFHENGRGFRGLLRPKTIYTIYIYVYIYSHGNNKEERK